MESLAFHSYEGDKILFAGHASFLAVIAGKRILFDPVWNSKPYEYFKFVPDQFVLDDALPFCDATIISHSHADHFCRKILKSLDNFFIMSGRKTLNEKMPEDKTWFALTPLKWLEILEGVEVYFVPHDWNGVDSCCFVRNKKNGYTFFHGNDTFLGLETLKKVRQDVPRVHVAALGYSFVHFWPFLQDIDPKKKASECERMKTKCLQQAGEFVDIFRPDVVIPNGNNIFYDDGYMHPLNQWLAAPHELKGASVMFAGDFVLGTEVHSSRMDIASYYKMLKLSLGDHNPTSLDIDFLHRPFDPIRKRLNGADRIPGHWLSINDIYIDLETLTIPDSRPDVSKIRSHRFMFSREVFARWYAGDITLEEAIGTRRFIFVREPDEYSPEVFAWMGKFL